MTRPRARLARAALLAALLLSACGDAPAPAPVPDVRAPRAVPVVVTAFPPLASFARRIAGADADVVCLLPADADAASWQPPDDDLETLQAADLVLLNGAGFEAWAATVALPVSRVVDTARAFAGELLQYEEAVVHSHGAAGEHAHEGVDGHVWLDPLLARQQAEAIRAALTRIRPGAAARFRQGFESLAADLGALDADLRALVAAAPRRTVVASHPAYNYLARRYGLDVVNVVLDPAVVPLDETLARLAARLAAHPATHVLWETAPRPEVAARVRAATGLSSVVVSPCESAAEADGDTVAAMRRNVPPLRAALGLEPTPR